MWPQVSPRPLTFSMNMVEPFTLNTSPVFAELMAGVARRAGRAAYADPAWRERVRDAWAAGPQGGIPPRWETYEIMESTANPELDRPAPRSTLAERAGRRPVRRCCSTSPLAEPTLRDIRGQGRRSPTTTRTASRTLLQEDGCTLGLSDAGAHVSQLCDAPLPPTCSASWVREQGRAHGRAGGAQADPGPGRAVRLRRPRRRSARASPPTSSCSTPTPSPPARCAGSTTSRPAPSASPPTSPRACATCSSTARHVIADGELRRRRRRRPPRPARAPAPPAETAFAASVRRARRNRITENGLHPMDDLPPTFTATRHGLHRLACYVIAPARKARTGHIGLRPIGDGFGTPPFDDGHADRRPRRRARSSVSGRRSITTLRAAAAFVGIELSAEPGVGDDLPPYEPDVGLAVDDGRRRSRSAPGSPSATPRWPGSRRRRHGQRGPALAGALRPRRRRDAARRRGRQRRLLPRRLLLR